MPCSELVLSLVSSSTTLPFIDSLAQGNGYCPRGLRETTDDPVLPRNQLGGASCILDMLVSTVSHVGLAPTFTRCQSTKHPDQGQHLLNLVVISCGGFAGRLKK